MTSLQNDLKTKNSANAKDALFFDSSDLLKHKNEESVLSVLS